MTTARTYRRLRRSDGDGPVRARVLIVCEGSQTEPGYLEALCWAKGLSAREVEVYGDERGSDPMSVVEAAGRLAGRTLGAYGDRPREHDQVWCAFDRDTHQCLDEALARAGKLGFEVAFSNPCFEVWLLLHFRYSSAPLTARDAVRALREYIPDYSKAADVYGLLAPLEVQAVQNAQRLRRYHTRAGDPATANPATTVDRLVAELDRIARL